MPDLVDQDHAQRAARLALEGLAPLYGLDVDTARVAFLQPLAASLLQQGEQLTRTIEPAVEPFFVGNA
jgi:hypothetical protein